MESQRARRHEQPTTSWTDLTDRMRAQGVGEDAVRA